MKNISILCANNILIDSFTANRYIVYNCVVDIYNGLGVVPDENGIINIDVSFDETWQKKGHTSHIGASAVIEVHSGFVID